MPMTVDEIVASLKTERDNLLNALRADSANPQKDYSFNGQSLNRTSWRSGISQRLHEINEQIALYDPFEIVARMI